MQRIDYSNLNVKYSETKVCVIVPARNEDSSIARCLNSIIKQDYPKENIEIIVVDDHSTDNTANEVRKIIKNHSSWNIELLNLNNNNYQGFNKKKAIEQAIDKSSAEILITTDADCWMNEFWIITIVSYFNLHQPKMLLSPVVFDSKKGIFQKLQALEFSSLIASTAGAIGIGRPIMANGANLAFSREAFIQSGGYNEFKNIASGDDVFLLYNFKRTFGKDVIHFLKNTDAMVFTQPLKSIRSFINQRIRWTSKSKAYKDSSIIFTALSVYLLNFLLLIGFISSIFDSRFLLATFIAFTIKLIIDLPILISYLRFTRQRALITFIPLILPFYFIYISIIGALGHFIPFKWERDI